MRCMCPVAPQPAGGRVEAGWMLGASLASVQPAHLSTAHPGTQEGVRGRDAGGFNAFSTPAYRRGGGDVAVVHASRRSSRHSTRHRCRWALPWQRGACVRSTSGQEKLRGSGQGGCVGVGGGGGEKLRSV